MNDGNFTATSATVPRGVALDLPAFHRVPVKWIRENACPPIKWRTVRDILPAGSATPADMEALRQEVLEYKTVKQITKKQWVNGTWSGNLLGVAPSKSQGIKDVGTVAQYRRLVEMGVPSGERPFKLADRLFYRVLSRDEDPALLFEYRKAAAAHPDTASWYRDLLQQGVTAALAQAGKRLDPRVRGSAHRIISNISRFLRSDLAEKPIVRKGSRNVLDPDAYPPTVFSVAVVAFIPSLQRERAGFVDRLSAFLTQPASKKTYSIQLGRKILKPTFHLLGEPIQADSSGKTGDLPFAIHWIELLVRLGAFERSATAQRILGRLLRECDEQGVWNPGNLRTLPRSPSNLADFACPLEHSAKTAEARKADVTFRLALIAKLLDLPLEFT